MAVITMTMSMTTTMTINDDEPDRTSVPNGLAVGLLTIEFHIYFNLPFVLFISRDRLTGQNRKNDAKSWTKSVKSPCLWQLWLESSFSAGDRSTSC